MWIEEEEDDSGCVCCVRVVSRCTRINREDLDITAIRSYGSGVRVKMERGKDLELNRIAGI